MEPDQLVHGLRSGEEGAVKALVQAHEKNLYRLALSLLDDPAEAQEATQDAFLAALKAIHSYRGEAALGTWLHRITINLCRTRLRRRRNRERLTRTLQAVFRLASQGRDTHSESVVIQNEAVAEVWRAIQDLGEKHRLVVILYYYHDMTVEEIAQSLEIPAGTVYSRLETAHRRLRGIFKNFPGGDHPMGSQSSNPSSKVDPASQEDASCLCRNLPDGGQGYE